MVSVVDHSVNSVGTVGWLPLAKHRLARPPGCGNAATLWRHCADSGGVDGNDLFEFITINVVHD
jgi:hypothetical protein